MQTKASVLKLKNRSASKNSSSPVSDKNQEDIRLLHDQPAQLIAKYQSTVALIVGKFVTSGFFRPDEKDDVIQTINQKLLEDKIKKIQQFYNGSCYLSTYLSKIIYNICLELGRKPKSPELLNIDNIEASQEGGDISENVVIQEELQRFDTILKLFDKSRRKLKLCLKLMSRIPCLEDEFKTFCPNFKTGDLTVMQEFFKDSFYSLTDKEIYQRISPVFNHCEQKNNSPDALRKWVSLKIDELIDLLNGNPPRAAHTKETVLILTQLYFEKFEGNA